MGKGIPAKNNGNRMQPNFANQIPMPTNLEPGWGGKRTGGGGVPAKNNGNRMQPNFANKIQLPDIASKGNPKNK